MSLRARAAAVAFLLASCATTQAFPAKAPRIALTIDDLPVHGPIPAGQTPASVTNGVIAALSRAHVPAYGFVNAHWIADQPETLDVLKAWRAAGLPLGNHTWSHNHLDSMTDAEFEQEVAKDEPVLQELAGSSDWHWFRYPFLEEGKTPQRRQAVRAILARRGYRIAEVSMDFSDWAFTEPYARCSAVGNTDAIAHLETMYVAAARESIGYYRTLSRKLYGRDIPYVVLLHDSAFEARMLPRLIQLYRSAGFRFVSLPAAEHDPYYADQVNPALPAQPEGLEDKAGAHGIPLPHHTDYLEKLNAICPTAAAARSSP